VVLATCKEPAPTPDPEPQPLTLEEAVQTVNAEDLKTWLHYIAGPECEGRYPNTDGYRKAAQYIEERCGEWGLTTERQDVNGCFNILCYIPGSDPSMAREIVVVGAHLDHLGQGRSGSIYYGADDNGSGSVGLMAIARALSQMAPAPRPILLQWYTREEQGLVGSSHYASNPTFPKDSPGIESHVVMLNMDMIGRARWAMRSSEPPRDSALMDLNTKLDALEGKYPSASSVFSSGGSRSDHASFRRHMPVAWAHTANNSDYHTSRDTVDKIQYPQMAKVVQCMLELAHNCAYDGTTDTGDPAFEMPMSDHGGAPFLSGDEE
jgi:hypothetical protein